MKYVAFLFFLIVTVIYVWIGKDNYNKKDWLFFGVKFLGVLAGTFILGFIFKSVQAIGFGLADRTAGSFMMALCLSFFVILGMKFLVVMLCTMFGRILDFHKKFNSDNYEIISSLSNSFSHPLFILAKCLISLGSILIFYGIWLSGSFG